MELWRPLRLEKEVFFEHFSLRKRFILVLSFIFLVGLLTGIITVTQLTKNFTISDITDFLLFKTAKGQSSVFSYFFRRFINCLLASALVFVCCFWFWTSFLVFPYCFFRGYQLGVSAAIFCLLFGAGGVLNVALIYLPLQLLSFFVLANFCSITLHSCYCRRRLRYDREVGSHTFFVLFIVLFFIVCLIESLLVPTLLRKIA